MSEPDRSGGSPAVTRAIRILDLLAEQHGRAINLSEIARALGLAKSSASNLCAALEEGGLIRPTAPGYLLARRTVELGSAYLSGFDEIREFYRACEESDVLCRQLVQVAMLDGARVLYLAVYQGREKFPLSAGVGDRYPASTTAVGTILLSELTPQRVAALYWDQREFVGFTGRSTATIAQLQAKLASTRKRGYAIDEGEVHSSVLGIAVLVPGSESGSPTFGLGVSIVHPTGAPEERETVLTALREAASRLTRPRLLSA
ncbi:MAG TPA: IclR family transcriptional regulator [Nakamurella sp.]